MSLMKIAGKIGGGLTKCANDTWNKRKDIARGIGNTIADAKQDIVEGYKEAREGKSETAGE